MRVLVQQPTRWAIAVALAIAAAESPAAAQRVIYTADGTINVGYTQVTQEQFEADPMAEPGDRAVSSTGGVFTEIRPGISLQSGKPRLLWTLGYQFSTNLVFGESQSTAYTNTANFALAMLPSKFTQATVSASVAQGGTSFLLSQRAAEEGEPQIRAPGNPSTFSVSFAQSLTWEVGRRVNLRQGLGAGASAPSNDFDQYSASLTGTLGIDRVFRRDTGGLELRASLARLQELNAEATRYTNLTTAAVLRWNHDFSYKWNGLATAGVEQVYSGTGGEPLGLFPTGSALLRYTSGKVLAAAEFGHGSAYNLQVGAVSLADRITARGAYTLDVQKLRTLSLSAGFLHNQPIGEVSELAAAAAAGDAIQIDAGFTTAINKLFFLTARYSLAYQFGQDSGIRPSLAHIASVGVTARYTNASEADKAVRRKALRPGGRVDGADGKQLLTGDDAPPP
jgi:hypothetical protein